MAKDEQTELEPQPEPEKAEPFPTPPKDERNIQQRLWAAQEKCNYIQKDQEKAGPDNQNKGQAFSTVSWEAVIGFVKPFLHAERILVLFDVLESNQDGNRHWSRVKTRFINIDDPKDEDSATTEASFTNNQGQGPASCLSLNFKFALQKVMMLVTGEKEEREIVEYEPERQPKTEAEVFREGLLNEVRFHIKDLKLDQQKVSLWCIDKFDGKLISECNADTLDFIIDKVKENENGMFSPDNLEE